MSLDLAGDGGDQSSAASRLLWPGERPPPAPAPDHTFRPITRRVESPAEDSFGDEERPTIEDHHNDRVASESYVPSSTERAETVSPAELRQISDDIRDQAGHVNAALERLTLQSRQTEAELASLNSRVADMMTEQWGVASQLSSQIAEMRDELRVVRDEIQGVRRRLPVAAKRNVEGDGSRPLRRE